VLLGPIEIDLASPHGFERGLHPDSTNIDGAPRGRARRADNGCSWPVLAIAITLGTAIKVGFDLQTVICQEPSVSRESVAGTKLLQPADASLTIWWRQLMWARMRAMNRIATTL
jgi:hypothetical protein